MTSGGQFAVSRDTATTAMGFMHTALGENVADYLTGRKTLEQTLQAIEASYTTRAREAGLLK